MDLSIFRFKISISLSPVSKFWIDRIVWNRTPRLLENGWFNGQTITDRTMLTSLQQRVLQGMVKCICYRLIDDAFKMSYRLSVITDKFIVIDLSCFIHVFVIAPTYEITLYQHTRSLLQGDIQTTLYHHTRSLLQRSNKLLPYQHSRSLLGSCNLPCTRRHKAEAAEPGK